MRRISPLALIVFLFGCARSVAPLPEVPQPTPTPAPPIEFPRDAGPHDALTEWWYVTGHLLDAGGHRYGFEFTVFQARRQSAPTGYLAHFAVSDIDAGRFSHQAHAVQGEPAASLPLNVGGWTFSGNAINATMDDSSYQLQVTLEDDKPPALHHGGYFDYGAYGATYYYSRTRLSVAGTLNGASVNGQAWMDHQWGNFVVSRGLAWDWYSLQLDDRTELMQYVLRGPNGETTSEFGTFDDVDGTTHDLGPGTVHAQALGTWTSPHTGGVYPSGWRITLADGRTLTLTPLLLDQELYFPNFGGPAYWEGAVSISGDATGQGYVELTGYAP